MNLADTNQPNDLIGVLKQFVRRRRSEEFCEICSRELGAEHVHLLELVSRKLICACDACALLFSSQTHARYKKIPRRIWQLENFEISDAEWDALMIPINMAFFFQNSEQPGVSVLYPSPAGATESHLSLENWDAIVAKNPVVREMESDVEALLVSRMAHAPDSGGAEYYLLPVDECYRLTGVIRRDWRGFSGGSEVWQQISMFFDSLRSKATVIRRTAHA